MRLKVIVHIAILAVIGLCYWVGVQVYEALVKDSPFPYPQPLITTPHIPSEFVPKVEHIGTCHLSWEPARLNDAFVDSLIIRLEQAGFVRGGM